MYIDRTVAFCNQARRLENQLAVINQCTVELQRRGNTLSDYRLVFDTRIEQV